MTFAYLGHGVVTWVNQNGADWLTGLGTVGAVAAAWVAYRQFRSATFDLRVTAHRQINRKRTRSEWAWIVVRISNRGGSEISINEVVVGERASDGGLASEWAQRMSALAPIGPAPWKLEARSSLRLLLEPKGQPRFDGKMSARLMLILSNGEIRLVRVRRWPKRWGALSTSSYAYRTEPDRAILAAGPTASVAGKFELYKDPAGRFRFRLKAANGEIIATSQAYTSKAGAENGIESVRTNASAGSVDDLA